MEYCEFEEKEYEGPLKNQLLNGSNLEWTPGQVFEKYFGIDAAINVATHPIWDKFGCSVPKNGVKLSDYNFSYIQRKINQSKHLPDYSLNIFLQVKRPEYLYGNNSEYARKGIKGSYYRFKITEHQQLALEKLHRKLKNKALVLYASPVFHTQQDLYRSIRNGDLVDRSTFVKAITLSSHTKWVYDSEGTHGLACSEIEQISDDSFNVMLNKLKGTQLIQETESEENRGEDNNIPFNNLSVLLNEIDEVFNELGDSNPLTEEYFYRDSIIKMQIEDKFECVYMRILSALEILKVNWLVI